MKAVHFGAGNIGRGFIGLLLSQAGYEVCFVDVNEELVSELKARGEYPVTLASEGQETTVVKGITALNSASEPEAAARAVAEADIVTTAVGVNILKFIAPTIAEGLKLRLQGEAAPLHIIACENAIGGSTQLKEHVYGLLDEETRRKADSSIAFPDAAVDRIVPLQQHEDRLKVVVEPFYEWAVDRSQMLDGFKPVEGVHYVDRLEPYIERKLFTVNTGHCSAAYIGFLKGYETIQDAVKDDEVAKHVRAVLDETGAALIHKHGFNPAEHQAYIATILDRFRNPALTDEVVRVGRSPIRKLSPGDRLVSPAMLAFESGLAYKSLAKSMAAALLFDVPEDPESAELQRSVREIGPSDTASKYTGIAGEHPIMGELMEHYEALKIELENRS
ncbi:MULTISPECIES: mannitol-1-phosphate 5-dehydrogenase [Paenibacillus]|jgi:mannitol-1-phosphate 5-dehydrogenase|uniref:Mannitol-1-phosphate 5-dehydrogenase n=2 Tax=Paenibacillus lactis TaxID=228574 RepID=G4HD09_9BACL|nr:mannitol-1-phosphate 5-dehydrogenase [Paenibacillus lactis]EHB65935.1 Mannitol dehydrogenase domain protein [Paenibacillus lactis 154]MBP1891318.1 mannitol-1-phosphate 5-dehydrogenase [Paenibacillus lactis]HAF98310.1 mannitol-1-phosphate 5-dehydrogenase [Paenibacillus lactis]